MKGTTIKIVNSTNNEFINNGWRGPEVSCKIRGGGEEELKENRNLMSWGFKPGEVFQVEIPKDQEAIIEIMKEGYHWDNIDQIKEGSKKDYNCKLKAEPGGTYYVKEDEESDCLMPKDCVIISLAIIEELQLGTFFRQIWPNIAAKNTFKKTRTPEELMDDYEFYAPSNLNAFEMYRPLTPEGWVSKSELDKALSLGGKARIDIYCRSLMEFISVEEDHWIVCYSYDCATGSVAARQFNTMEGQLYRFEYNPAHVASCMKEKMPSVLEALKKVPQNSYNFSCVKEVPFTQQEIIVSLPRYWSENCHKYFDAEAKKNIFMLLLINSRKNNRLPYRVLTRIFQALTHLEYVPVVRMLVCQREENYHDSVTFTNCNTFIAEVFETTNQMLELGSMEAFFEGNTPAGAEAIAGFGERRVVPIDVDLPRCWPYYFKYSPKWRSDFEMTPEELKAYLADTDSNR